MNKPSYPHPIIAREGWPFIAIGFIASVLVTAVNGWLSLPFWLFTIFALQFFRDPARYIPQDADAVLSPVDGRVVVVERAQDPYRKTEALKISIFMNVFNVHSQKSPVDGTVEAVEYNRGKFLNADLDKASTENERNAVLVTTATGREITFVQVAGLVARRILCYTQVGRKLSRGERYGFIRFGSRVDVYLPLDAKAEVAIGDKVTGVTTILARLPLQSPDAKPFDDAPVNAANAALQTVAATAPQTAESVVTAAENTAEVSQAAIEEAADKVREAAAKAVQS
ncbi:phosphatidylserine decarboxylase [Neisseria sp. N95_16]|uniref:Phosphatidylserine decarboxylase proenzyme n=1 Tax=Neisseria brasiliensis TaxID=2666100 RepID=A0A5Q3S1E8_9NEIS|nr:MULTISPECIES: phosphatidylserine decarboxylase [Neisseria]MRN38898.1 phosphatidylserine decarboxylase [Neisseria brasiliensis]PJO10535.1 phosphatidylserine decarboxylase [Neisseria sp. N95_16]PJO77299.1 phosphatidylserine decarboxylase [Neisseria sp. N177_16]QGL25779.1 phosphatidylserine decarboxylase [Neisseria brasiliensis]